MKTVLVALVLAGGIAHAEPRATIKVPAGFTLTKVLSEALTRQLNELGHFGLPAKTTLARANGDIYVTAKQDVMLTVTLVGAAIKDERDAAARAAVDELHAASQRAALVGTGISEEGWQEKIDPAGKQIEATLVWRDATAKTRSTSRLIVVADASHMTALTGECYVRDDADPKLVADCKAALATLDPGVDAADRIALALAPTGARPTPPEPTAGSGVEPPRMTDGTRAPLPPMTVPQEQRATDRRPVYVGIGLVVFAAVFWWNRRRRARREDESE